MFEVIPEIAVICVASGIFLIARGVHALLHNSIKIRKAPGFPWRYDDLTLERNPRLFRLTAWSILVLGLFFLVFPFFLPYFY